MLARSANCNAEEWCYAVLCSCCNSPFSSSEKILMPLSIWRNKRPSENFSPSTCMPIKLLVADRQALCCLPSQHASSQVISAC